MAIIATAIPSYRSLTINMTSDNTTNRTHLLTPKQMLDMLQISRPTLYRLMGQRQIPFCKVGGSVRFRLIDIEAYLEKNSIKSLVHKL